MKKIAMTCTAAIVLATSAFAGSNTGCGLGSTIFYGKEDSLAIQVLAATTNGTSGNQTFGISSGTLGCHQPSKLVSNEKLEKFVAANMDAIAYDMARGQGETLDTIATMLDISDKAAFKAALKSNFDKIYASQSVQSGSLLDAIATM